MVVVLHRGLISVAADEQEGSFDSMAEPWFDDLAAAEAAFTSAAGQVAHADADAHVARRARLDLTEHTIMNHPCHLASSSLWVSSAAST